MNANRQTPPEKQSPTRRTILHADLDAFFAAVEQRDHPEWRGQPVIVGAAPDRRGVVCAASYEARRFGIRSAMPSSQAGKRCPHGVFVPPDMPRYRQASREVFACFNEFTPKVEPLSIDEAFLDVTGAQRLFGDGRCIAQRLKQTVRARTGLIISVGVAPNKFLAKLAGDLGKPDGLVVTPFDPAEIREFLAPLAVSALWGVGPATVTRLQNNGLNKILDIQRISLVALRGVVGEHAASHFKALAEGYDPREVAMDRAPEKSISKETTFGGDCHDPETVRRVLGGLVDAVGARLRHRGLYAATAQVKIRFKGFHTVTRRRRLPRPCHDDASLREEAMAILGTVQLSQPIRLVGFGTSDLSPRGQWQPTLFDALDDTRARRERLSQSVDVLRARFGSEAVQRAACRPTETP